MCHHDDYRVDWDKLKAQTDYLSVEERALMSIRRGTCAPYLSGRIDRTDTTQTPVGDGGYGQSTKEGG